MMYARLISVVFVSLLTAPIVSAVPMPSLLIARSLSKRDGVVFQDCGDTNDDRYKKAEQAWSEAAELAAFIAVGTLDDGTEFEEIDTPLSS